MFLTDKELVEFFQHDLDHDGDSGELLPIPTNQECIFMMTYLKGKTRDLLVFCDSGCNFWVSVSGVPENELCAIKLNENRDDMSLKVAGGAVIQAEAEWGALIPLEDGSHQIVRGLTLPVVTADMPEVNLVPFLKQLKQEAPRNKEVQAIRVPEKVGGRVDMILGFLYAKVYPEPVRLQQWMHPLQD